MTGPPAGDRRIELESPVGPAARPHRFRRLAAALDDAARAHGGLTLTIPIAYVEARRGFREAPAG